jgi:hypothetical protein
VLIIIDIGQNASNPNSSITTIEPVTKDNRIARLVSPAIDDMYEVPSIMNGPTTAKGRTATPTVEDTFEVPGITTNKPYEVPSIMNGPTTAKGRTATPTVEDTFEVPGITTNKPTAKGGTAAAFEVCS